MRAQPSALCSHPRVEYLHAVKFLEVFFLYVCFLSRAPGRQWEDSERITSSEENLDSTLEYQFSTKRLEQFPHFEHLIQAIGG